MNHTNTGGPAFPTQNEHQSGNQLWHYEGMTLRDYFAASAITMVNMNNYSTMSPETRSQFIARSAYALADDMLKARTR